MKDHHIFLWTVKPVLTATSEQQPPVYNGQLEPQFSKILSLYTVNNNHLRLNLWTMATFLGS